MMFQWPVAGPITASFGWRDEIPGIVAAGLHTGTDIGAPEGAHIRAAADGRIKRVWYDRFTDDTPAGGNMVAIDHGNGWETRYAHMEYPCYWGVGAFVTRSDLIGYVGDTGAATAAHLHYENLKDGLFVNPEDYTGASALNPQPELELEDMVHIYKTTGGVTEWALIIGSNATTTRKQSEADNLSLACGKVAVKINAYVYNALLKNCKVSKV